MALGSEMERNRDVAQRSAAAVSFFLDREGRKKFLRTATNQELEAENAALKSEVQHLEEANDCLYNDMLKAEMESVYRTGGASKCRERESSTLPRRV